LFIFASLINLKKLNDMRRIDLLKFAICVMAVCALAMFNSGCEKENLNDLKQPTSVKKPRVISDDEIMKDLPEVKDGRLVFKDSVSFANYVQWLFDNQDNAEKIYEVNASMGFVCMHEIYDRGLELLLESESATCPYIEEHPTVFHASEVDGSIIQDLQALDLVGYVANEYGVFQVGKKIYRSTYDYTYCITNSDESKIQALLNLKGENTSDPFILSYPTFFKHAQTRNVNSYRTVCFPGEKWRLVARLKGGYVPEANVSLYEEEADGQRKIGGWVGWALDSIKIVSDYGHYNWYYTGPQAQQYGTDLHLVILLAGKIVSTGQKIKRIFANPGTGSYKCIDEASSCVKKTFLGYKDGNTRSIVYTNAFTGAY
jgi:hypothetical protein